ncbi:hypothetical protein [Pedobacter sp. Leaf170]|uniref:hypothetical protein n=1 Tax=Pedobacter sp. Leaf170 TaxID=2876558 RepID=UPI001E2A1EEA|nr:hypothetical protein [Pedobacter sp. Leaf170]
MKEIQTLLSVENLPYLYQSDFYNIGFNKRGYYLDSEGNQYRYNIPESEYFLTVDELDYDLNNDSEHDSTEQPDDNIEVVAGCTIKPSELFSKLNLFELIEGDLKLELSKEVIEDLLNAPIVESEIFIMDSGWRTKSILIYILELDIYRQIVLNESGNANRVNQSKHTNEILKLLKEP